MFQPSIWMSIGVGNLKFVRLLADFLLFVLRIFKFLMCRNSCTASVRLVNWFACNNNICKL